MLVLPTLSCERCGWSWTPRKPAPPKKCPRCQHPYRMVVESVTVDGGPAAVGSTPEESNYAAGALEILRSGDTAFVDIIRGAVDSFRALRRSEARRDAEKTPERP